MGSTDGVDAMAKPRIARKSFEESKGRRGWRLRFYDSKNSRRSIWLGPLSEGEAETWRVHVEHLANTARAGEPPSPATTNWTGSLGLAERMKLERVGLIAATAASRQCTIRKNNQAPEKLGEFLEWYIKTRSAKPRTVKKWEQAKESLLNHFGAARRLDSITAADAERWRSWVAEHGNLRDCRSRTLKDGTVVPGRTDLSDATVRRKTGQARQFFNFAIRAAVISKNPFSDLPATVHANNDRKFFVSREMVAQMLEHAPGVEWEAIIALARFGGLRAPSEVMRLRWKDVDFANRRLCVHASKTEHHRNKGIRYCPIFPELRPYLENLAELAAHRGAKPTDHVITKPRGSESVLRPGFLRILKRAGLEIYPKLFQNLRASRETELLDDFPIADVCSWIGNSPKIAMEHYAMQRQDSFDRAAGLAEKLGGPVGGPKNGNQGQDQATCDSVSDTADDGFYQEKQGSNLTLAACGNSGQLHLNRPGRT